jgi:excinuclease ABC subunit B
VLFYAEKRTDSIAATLGEVERRRARQTTYNQEHGIVPRSAVRRDDSADFSDQLASRRVAEGGDGLYATSKQDLAELKALMLQAAEELRFEEAAQLRDQIKALEAGERSVISGGIPLRKPRKAQRRKRR